MSITITVPNDDHVALRAMAKALEEIAVARGAPKQSTQIGELNYKININTTQASAALEDLIKQAEPDNTSQQVESLAIPVEANGATYETDLGSDEPEAVCLADLTGTPWDERIHSTSKALNGDGTWRVRRKPADKTPEEWTTYVDAVQTYITSDEEDLERLFPNGFDADYKANFEQPVEDEQLCEDEACDHHDTPHICVTPEGDDFHVDAGVVTEQEVAAIPAPPLPVPPVPPVSVPEDFDDEELDLGNGKIAPALARLAGTQPPLTFPQVMQFLTERHGRITSAQVDQIIADMGLKSIMDLNTQPEHTGPFIARVKALLGE